MSHLEHLIAEYLEWKGYLIRRNIKVGKRLKGGWEMELDVIGYHPQRKNLVHYEPSIDAHSWATREKRYEKKFRLGRKYILQEVFPWLGHETKLEQVAVFISHPKSRDTIAGGRIISVDELMRQIRDDILPLGHIAKNAIPEQFPLLRTVQLGECGYYKRLSASGE